MVLVGVYHVLEPWNHTMLGAFDKPTAPGSQQGLRRVLELAFAPTALALHYVTVILQLVMNARARTFAGQSRVAAALLLLAHLPTYAVHAGMFGRYAVRTGVSWNDALRDILLFATAWQALTMSPVDQSMEDEADK
jgi:hypothetical protein